MCYNWLRRKVGNCSVASSLTVYQVFILGNVWEQLVECLVVLYETLQREKQVGQTESEPSRSFW